MISIIDGKPLSFIETDIQGLFYRKLNPFYDFRGQFLELWNNHIFNDWIEDDVSISRKNVFRGFHLDKIATKLITPFYGDIFIAFVDKEFNCCDFYCTDGQRYQFLVKPNIGIAHYVLSDIGMLHYKQTHKYNKQNQETIHWDDPRIDIHFPFVCSDSLIISERDI